MKKPPKLYTTHINFFPFMLGVFIDKEEFESEVVRMTDRPYFYDLEGAALCKAFISKVTGELCVSVFFNMQKITSDVQLLTAAVHEAVHVKQRVMEHIGEEKVGDETEAYLIGAITMAIVDELAELRKPKQPPEVKHHLTLEQEHLCQILSSPPATQTATPSSTALSDVDQLSAGLLSFAS